MSTVAKKKFDMSDLPFMFLIGAISVTFIAGVIYLIYSFIFS